MGCTYSGPNGRRDPNIPSFKVHNVDVQGAELNRGRIEIREGDLVLYQKGKDEIRWPLRWLRRYGYEAELFSFESGRRCATGTGIYAFKCSNAEALFNLVRETIDRAGQEDQRAQHHQQQQQQQQHRMLNHGSGARLSSSSRAAPQLTTATSLQVQDSFAPTDTIELHNGSTMHYVNGPLMENRDPEYINTGPPRSVSAAFQIDETAALVDFLHNPPSFGRGQSQLNYAEIEMVDAPASMENLLDEAGLGAIHNVPRRGLADGANRLSQPSLASGGGRHDSARFSMPNDLVAAAAQDSDSMLQAGDSDVFLDVTTDGFACSNYVNVAAVEESSIPKTTAPVPPPFNLMLPSTHEMNYANLAFEQPKVISEVNYITIDHNAQTTDNVPVAGGAVVGPGNATTSPMSPTSCVSLPDSPSRKTRSYAKIDFDRTQALSNTARAQDDEQGSRKTRHNSSIGELP